MIHSFTTHSYTHTVKRGQKAAQIHRCRKSKSFSKRQFRSKSCSPDPQLFAQWVSSYTRYFKQTYLNLNNPEIVYPQTLRRDTHRHTCTHPHTQVHTHAHIHPLHSEVIKDKYSVVRHVRSPRVGGCAVVLPGAGS